VGPSIVGALVGVVGGADSTNMPNLVSARLYTLPVCTKHITNHAWCHSCCTTTCILFYLGNHYHSWWSYNFSHGGSLRKFQSKLSRNVAMLDALMLR
jgi:hypothetical protein